MCPFFLDHLFGGVLLISVIILSAAVSKYVKKKILDLGPKCVGQMKFSLWVQLFKTKFNVKSKPKLKQKTLKHQKSKQKTEISQIFDFLSFFPTFCVFFVTARWPWPSGGSVPGGQRGGRTGLRHLPGRAGGAAAGGHQSGEPPWLGRFWELKPPPSFKRPSK